MSESRRVWLKSALRVVSAPFWAAAIARAATLVRFPYVQNDRADRCTLVWTTREPEQASVQYSTDRLMGQARTVTGRTREFLPSDTGLPYTYYQHNVDLTALTPNTQYYYRAYADSQNLTPLTPDGELTFRTAPQSGPFRFLAFGDSGSGTSEQALLGARMGEENAALMIHTGDLVYPSATYSGFQAYYFDVYRDLMKQTPFFPCPGNHEYDLDQAAAYFNVHALPTDDVPRADQGRYYSFDWGEAHFISLDANAPLTAAANGTGGMLQWLERDLQRTRKAWRIAYWHQPPYSTGAHEGDTQSALSRTHVIPILERYGVQLVFNGHEHNYHRTRSMRNGQITEDGRGTVYVTTGGGGAGLYPVGARSYTAFAESVHHYVRADVQASTLTVRAIRADGAEVDRATLAPLPRLSDNAAVSAASFTPALAPGMLVSVFGFNLAFEQRSATTVPLPSELGGVRLTLNDRPMPIVFVSPGQINAQLPFDVDGAATMRVTTANGSAETTLDIREAAPGIFQAGEPGPVPAIVHPSGALVTAATPAAAGEFVIIYLTGLGKVNGPLTAGQPTPVSPLLTTRVAVDVEVGGITVRPSFAGLVPGFCGLYQLNLQVPTLPGGNHALRVLMQGASSMPVTLALR